MSQPKVTCEFHQAGPYFSAAYYYTNDKSFFRKKVSNHDLMEINKTGELSVKCLKTSLIELECVVGYDMLNYCSGKCAQRCLFPDDIFSIRSSRMWTIDTNKVNLKDSSFKCSDPECSGYFWGRKVIF